MWRDLPVLPGAVRVAPTADKHGLAGQMRQAEIRPVETKLWAVARRDRAAALAPQLKRVALAARGDNGEVFLPFGAAEYVGLGCARARARSLSLIVYSFMYVHACMYVCMYVCMYLYIRIHSYKYI